MTTQVTDTEAELTDLGGIVSSTEDEFWRTVVSRADVGDVWLILHQNLCRAKVTQLQNTGVRVQKQVLRLDISVTDTLRVDVGE